MFEIAFKEILKEYCDDDKATLKDAGQVVLSVAGSLWMTDKVLEN